MTGRKKALTTLTLFIVVSAVSLKASPAVGPANPAIDEKKIEDIVKTVASSVVKVEARNGMRKIATGVVIDKDGTIVTTALISPRDEEINVITAEGKRIKAEFKGFDTQTRIGLIQAKDKSLEPITAGKSEDLKPGAWIGVVGLSPENTPAITQGIVSSIASDKLRLNVWVVPGMSGSPVVNGAGQMVGLLRGAYTDEQPIVFEFREMQIVGSGTVFSRAESPSAGMALAVPVDIVNSVAADIKKSGKVERGWLGVSVGEADGRLEVAVVEPKSPAESAKIKEGDVILEIDGKKIVSGETLSSVIRGRKPGQDVTIKIERDGKPMDVKAKLGAYTDEEARRELALSFPRLFPPKGEKPEKGPESFILPKDKFAPWPQRPEFRQFFWGKRKFIGVTLWELNKELADNQGIKDGKGLLIAEIADDGPAKKAGLKVGDVILRADGKRLEAVADLSAMIQDKKKGDKVKIEYVRDKKTMTVDVEIAEEERSVGEEEPTFQEVPNKPGLMFRPQIQEIIESSVF